MDYSIQNNEQLSERYSWPVGAGDPDSDAPRLLVSDERFHYVKLIEYSFSWVGYQATPHAIPPA